jgi:hypothetical protein
MIKLHDMFVMTPLNVMLLQEGDLKYMLAFATARGALEWCLLVQEASMYLHWPDDSDRSVTDKITVCNT